MNPLRSIAMVSFARVLLPLMEHAPLQVRASGAISTATQRHGKSRVDRGGTLQIVISARHAAKR